MWRRYSFAAAPQTSSAVRRPESRFCFSRAGCGHAGPRVGDTSSADGPDAQPGDRSECQAAMALSGSKDARLHGAVVRPSAFRPSSIVTKRSPLNAGLSSSAR